MGSMTDSRDRNPRAPRGHLLALAVLVLAFGWYMLAAVLDGGADGSVSADRFENADRSGGQAAPRSLDSVVHQTPTGELDRGQRVLAGSTTRLVIQWADGQPAAGAQVFGLAGPPLVADAGGWVEVPGGAVRDITATTVRIQPPCWSAPGEYVPVDTDAPGDPPGRACRVLLPCEADVSVVVNCQREVAERLEFHGFRSLGLRAIEPEGLMPKCVAKSAVSFTSPRQECVVRVPLHPLLRIATVFVADAGPVFDAWVRGGPLVVPERTRIARAEVDIDQEILFSGQVLDHLGAPVPAASVEWMWPNPAGRGGYARTLIKADDLGRFLAFGERGRTGKAVVRALGVESLEQPARAGDLNCTLRLDLGRLRRLRVVSGESVVKRYRCSPQPLLWGCSEPPTFREQPESGCWMPDLTPFKALYVAWEFDGRLGEVRVEKAHLVGADAVVVDVSNPAVPCSASLVVRDEAMRFSLTLALNGVQHGIPLGDLARRLTQPEKERRFRWLVPGDYKLYVIDAQTRDLVMELPTRIVDGDVHVDLGELTRR